MLCCSPLPRMHHEEEELELSRNPAQPNVFDSIDTVCQGVFDVLPDEMRTEVIEKLVEARDWHTLRTACQINWQWKQEVEYLWRRFCEREQLLKDEDLFQRLGKDWKWMCECFNKKHLLIERSIGRAFLPKPAENPENKPVSLTLGSAQISFFDGDCFYFGQWSGCQREGIGRMSWTNGDRYVGHWHSNLKHGYGILIWQNGDRYEGFWTHDRRHGEVKYQYGNGGQYHGYYESDERHGSGRYTWPDGDYFEGTWRYGGRSGKGTLTIRTASGEWQKLEQDWNESPSTSYSAALPPKHPHNQEIVVYQQQQFGNSFPPSQE